MERYAAVGAPEPEIVAALGITEAMLQDRETAEKFRRVLAKGHASYKLELREQIWRRGTRTTEKAGSVYAQALQARNHLDWDRDTLQHQLPPDLTGARDRLRETFQRLATARSEIEGRKITPLELVHREVFGAGAEIPVTGGE